jgi:hypothetical protein
MLTEQTMTDTPRTALNVAEIADHYGGMLYGIGRRYRLTPEECDDAAQSTWLALCQKRRPHPRPAPHSRMAGHHDAPIRRHGNRLATSRTARLRLDRWVLHDRHRSGHGRHHRRAARNIPAVSSHRATARPGTTPHPATARPHRTGIRPHQPRFIHTRRQHRPSPRPRPAPAPNPPPRPRIATHPADRASKARYRAACVQRSLAHILCQLGCYTKVSIQKYRHGAGPIEGPHHGYPSDAHTLAVAIDRCGLGPL